MRIVQAGSAPKGTYIYVGPGSRFGNPFAMHGRPSKKASKAFRSWLPTQPELLALIASLLKGQVLGCTCTPGADCHCQTLLAVANGRSPIKPAPAPIFVFGSNLCGAHGRGAAKTARDHFGAETGISEGLTGKAYALPTKDHQLEPLNTDSVANSLRQLFEYAKQTPTQTYQLTRVGCGLANIPEREEYLSKLAASEAPANVLLPGVWQLLRKPRLVRLIVAGGRDYDDYVTLVAKLDHLLQHLPASAIEIVSGAARGADLMGERYAVEKGYRIRRIPALWETQGRKVAGMLRNEYMGWYGTHLVGFWDGQSRGTGGMLNFAKGQRLKVRTVRYPVKQVA